jgi:hypothetical protein
MVNGLSRSFPVPVPNRGSLRLLAGVLLCASLMTNFGGYTPIAFGLLLSSLLALAVSGGAEPGPAPAWAVGVAAASLGLMTLRSPSVDGWGQTAASLLLVAGAAGACLARSRRLAAVGLGAAVTAVALLVVLPWRWGRGLVDVFSLLQTATGELLAGHNPYAPTVPTYVIPDATGALNPVPAHFSYGPGALLLHAPGRLLGDERLSGAVLMALCLVVFAVLAVRSGNRARTVQSAALCAAFPLTAPLILYSFAEVDVLAGLALWLLLRDRHRRLGLVALTVAMATKPTIALLLIPYALWLPRARRDVAAGVAGVMLLNLPFAIATGPAQLIYDQLGVFVDFPTLYSGLTLTSYLHATFGAASVPAVATLLLGAAALIFTVARRPHDQADLLSSAALITVIFFLCAKYAYVNYYAIPALLMLMTHPVQGLTFAREEVRLPTLALSWRRPVTGVARPHLSRLARTRR